METEELNQNVPNANDKGIHPLAGSEKQNAENGKQKAESKKPANPVNPVDKPVNLVNPVKKTGTIEQLAEKMVAEVIEKTTENILTGVKCLLEDLETNLENKLKIQPTVKQANIVFLPKQKKQKKEN